jgi:RND family efflux transporter MFP subunit
MMWIKGAIAVLLVAAGAGCRGESGELPAGEEPVDVAVSTAVASHAVMAIPATVVATEEAALATRISGTIRRMRADIGANVSSGQALAELDTKEVNARISSAEAGEQLARQWHERIASLAVDGAATAQELDDAEARLGMAEAALGDARAQRDYVVLRAPFAGVVTGRMADPGDLALPGVPILRMIGTEGLKVEADLPADLAGRLAVGTDVTVLRLETARRYPARITRIVPAIERSSRRFRIEARFEATPAGLPDIPPGTFVRMELDQPAASTRWIPADAVVNRGQLRGVFVVEAEHLRLRWVRLGQQIDETIELLAGPPHQALLVRQPNLAFKDGQPVGTVRRIDWTPPLPAQQATRPEGVR